MAGNPQVLWRWRLLPWALAQCLAVLVITTSDSLLAPPIAILLGGGSCWAAADCGRPHYDRALATGLVLWMVAGIAIFAVVLLRQTVGRL